MRTSLLIGSAIVLGLGGFGCAPDSLDETDDYDVVITAREPGKVFLEYETFVMEEKVIDLSALSEDAIELDHSLDSTVLDAVAEGMAERGFDRVSVAGANTIHVVVGAVASNNWSWYGYYPWYGYGDYYYWYYPPVAVPVNTPSGSIVVLMIDANAAQPSDGGAMTLAPVVWAGTVRGLLGSDAANAARAENLIEQMFDQSPYLEVGPPLDPEPGLGVDGGSGMPDEDGGVL